MEHGVVGAGVPVLETRGGHAGQAVHATVGVCHGAWLWDGGIHGVEAGVER